MYGGGGGGSSNKKKSEFLSAAREAREERLAEKQRESAATRIQSSTRGWMTRVKMKREQQSEFDLQFPEIAASGESSEVAEKDLPLKPALQRYNTENI